MKTLLKFGLIVIISSIAVAYLPSKSKWITVKYSNGAFTQIRFDWEGKVAEEKEYNALGELIEHIIIDPTTYESHTISSHFTSN